MRAAELPLPPLPPTPPLAERTASGRRRSGPVATFDRGRFNSRRPVRAGVQRINYRPVVVVLTNRRPNTCAVLTRSRRRRRRRRARRRVTRVESIKRHVGRTTTRRAKRSAFGSCRTSPRASGAHTTRRRRRRRSYDVQVGLYARPR